jgi:hypothetical protein
MIHKSIEDADIELTNYPLIKELDQMKNDEGALLKDINDEVENIRAYALYGEDDY